MAGIVTVRQQAASTSTETVDGIVRSKAALLWSLGGPVTRAGATAGFPKCRIRRAFTVETVTGPTLPMSGDNGGDACKGDAGGRVATAPATSLVW
ncbi:hypothetical protein [Amycolatopsis sp. cmx-4-61]|uniref:hypothetical protein n=1 Tax=Amycolatopsis sp. cmx-4-61 TaxID=2790937 RepID=UPI00397D9C2A